METLKSVIILSVLVLLVYFGDARRSKELYTLKIDERGTRFNETVEINDKENSVVYKVPAHNDIVQSETRFDYKTGYFATRIPKLRECYIQRIPKGHSSPGSVRKYLQQYRVHKKGKSTVPVKTIATSVIKERRISRREISSRLAAFCGDFEVYEGREVYHREILQMKENETNGGRKKARSVLFSYPVNYLPRTVVSKKIDVDVGRKDKWETVTINTCEKLQKYVPELKIGGCFNNSDDWEYHCYAKTKTCIYKVKCKLDSSYKIRCEETHFYSGWTCCDVKCS